MRRSIIAALCHLEWVTKEKGSNAETLTGVQDCFTTKGKKSTWGVQYPVLFTTPPERSEDEALDPALKLGDIAQPTTAFDNPWSSILRALRGAFPLASVPCEPGLEVSTRSKRQRTKRLIVALLLLVGVCVSVTAQPRLQVMLDFFPNPNHVPLIVAVEQGFFADEGIEVEIVVPGSPSDPIKLVAAGAVDVALTPQINLIIARDAELPVIAIGSLIGSPLGGLLGLKENGIASLSDLRGRRIGYSLAPLEPILWRTMLASVGVEPGEYELINVGFNTALSLLSGQVDAIGAFRNFEVPQVTIEGHEAAFFPEEEYGVPQTEEIVIAANAERVSKDAPRMRAFLAALARGIAFTVEHPQEAFQSFIDAYPDLDDDLNRRAYEITLPLYTDGARIGPQAEWQDLQDYLFENGLIKSRSPLAEVCTEEYLPEK